MNDRISEVLEEISGLKITPETVKSSAGVAAAFVTTYATHSLPDLDGEEAKLIAKKLEPAPDKARLVFCMERRKIIYATGVESLLGYPDKDMSLLQYMALTTPRFALFMHEFAGKTLNFALSPQEDIENYGFGIELTKFHKSGHEVPLFSTVRHFESKQNILKKALIEMSFNPHMSPGPVIRYEIYGPTGNMLEKSLRNVQLGQPAISYQQLGLIRRLSNQTSQEKISCEEKEILSALFQRFGVLNLGQLLNFARCNQLI